MRGKEASDSEAEIMRRAALFEGAVAGLELDYSKTVLDQAVEAGFAEGTRELPIAYTLVKRSWWSKRSVKATTLRAF